VLLAAPQRQQVIVQDACGVFAERHVVPGREVCQHALHRCGHAYRQRRAPDLARSQALCIPARFCRGFGMVHQCATGEGSRDRGPTSGAPMCCGVPSAYVRRAKRNVYIRACRPCGVHPVSTTQWSSTRFLSVPSLGRQGVARFASQVYFSARRNIRR